MTTQITVPSLGESVTEATIAKWFKGKELALAFGISLTVSRLDFVFRIRSPCASITLAARLEARLTRQSRRAAQRAYLKLPK